MRKLHDKYFKLAKREGRLARSYYKLEEINRRNRVLRKGDRVLDLGACPGSWLEYALEIIGPRGKACAVDLNPIHCKFKGRVLFRKRDVREIVPEDFAESTTVFDVVLSDMAPNTSGVKSADQARSLDLCQAAADLARRVLVSGGNLVCKVLEGPGLGDMRRRLGADFSEVKVTKPDASRNQSCETYIVCKGFRHRRRTGKGAGVTPR